MVKDEADVIFDSISRMYAQVDQVIVADNLSTDGTREILEQFPGLIVVEDKDPAYYQSTKMTGLAQHAADLGATWVIPFDADEVWLPTANDLRTSFERIPPEALTVSATLYDHVPTGDDPPGPPIRSMLYRRQSPTPMRKVAVRSRPGLVIRQGNHSADFADVRTPLDAPGVLEVRHFPVRSPEQFIRKARNGAAAYAASNLPETTGAHWRNWGKFSDAQLREIFYKWYFRADPKLEVEIDGERQGALIYDPCP